ncbi:unnamed protein product [Parnassius mnemosyne]|uniref:THAP-type domain-containing protein n=1 Tax=Parnassius mnemosyne TaxID=213953 RepID=A0AAV1KUL2_9NEOP
MVSCSILGCNSISQRKSDNITFHRFPKESAIRNCWIIATGRDNWQPTKHSRVCSKHFEPHCFRRTKCLTLLSLRSIPKLYVHPQLESPVETSPRKRKLQYKLLQKTNLTNKQKKKIAVLRSKSWRLQKKNANLSSVIEVLKAESLINQETADALASIDPINKDILKRVADEHFTERVIYNHYPLLIKCISKHYLNARIHYATKKIVESGEKIRNFYTKLIIFKGQ